MDKPTNIIDLTPYLVEQAKREAFAQIVKNAPAVKAIEETRNTVDEPHS